MKSRKLRSLGLLHRMAKERETRASLLLVDAIRVEGAASEDANRARVLHAAALVSRDQCLQRGASLAMGEYELLGLLCGSLGTRETQTQSALELAVEQRAAKAEQAAMANRFTESVDDACRAARHAADDARRGELLAESIHLWIVTKERT